MDVAGSPPDRGGPRPSPRSGMAAAAWPFASARWVHYASPLRRGGAASMDQSARLPRQGEPSVGSLAGRSAHTATPFVVAAPTIAQHLQ